MCSFVWHQNYLFPKAVETLPGEFNFLADSPSVGISGKLIGHQSHPKPVALGFLWIKQNDIYRSEKVKFL